jgi:uracil-DNA glycosylase family 4
MNPSIQNLGRQVTACRKCPRLVAWREKVAREKRAAYRDCTYWGRPVPGFGDPGARVLVVGLAPGAHGANRTGRMFTGDRSGDWLYRALYHAGFANQPESVSLDDDLRLSDCWISAVVRCAPPANRPDPEERDRCLPWLAAEWSLLRNVRVVVALGGFAWDGVLRARHAMTGFQPRPRPRFGHGNRVVCDSIVLLGSYHPSQQNTFTGRLTEPMLLSVFDTARDLAIPAI